MTNNSIPIEELFRTCKARFLEFGMAEKRIYSFRFNFRSLIDFMEANSFKEYNHKVCDAFLAFENENPNIPESRKSRNRSLTTLINLVLDGKPYKDIRQKRAKHEMPDTEFGRIATEFCEKLYAEGQVRNSTILTYKYYLSLFAKAMKLDGVDVNDLTRAHVIRYLTGKTAAPSRKISATKVFLHSIYEDGVTREDLSEVLKGYSKKGRAKMVSYYTPEEIQKIESSINRSTKTGKRDYAIVLLASRLGLRASDITQLKFSNIDWENNTISLRQYKTGKRITLPLLSEVGDALIDYIVNSRPKCDVKTVFTRRVHPYASMRSVAGIVNETIKKSGVDISGRHHSAHALRHSLATAMMCEKTDLPTISSALGHSSTLPTMCYLGVNVSALIECSHDVPPVPESFYMQRGGIFYDR